MADVIITFKIMPESPDVDLSVVLESMKTKIEAFGATIGKSEEEPIAFGLKALRIIFVYDENKGATDDLEEECKTIEGVQNVEVVDVRRAFG